MSSQRILRLAAVMARVGLSRSNIYAKIAKKLFPRPIKLGRRSVGWLEADIDEWIQARIEATRNGEAI